MTSSAEVGGPAGRESDLVLWYDEAAPDNHEGWENWSLPIGNGGLGATVFGGVESERLQFNEKSLWTGGPGVSDYNFGNWEQPRPGALEGLRQRIWDEGGISADEVLQVMGHPSDAPRHRRFGAYQSFGDVRLDFPRISGAANGYRRSLDISSAVATVSFEEGGVTYSREYFATAADGVIVARLSADQPGKIDVTADIETPPNRSRTATSDDGRITVAGALDSNGLAYETQLQVLNDGGTRMDGPRGTVRVAGADSVFLVLAAGTDYADEYPTYQGEDPRERVSSLVDDAVAKGYEALRADHVADYTELFGRVSLDLGGELPDLPTDELRGQYSGAGSKADLALEELYFQYGRYLLISSSRPGSLAANLQGLWNDMMEPPWQSDYHLNINLQMNYWPAEITNLAETAEPLFSYVDGLREPGRVTAQQMYDVEHGWVAHHASNIWGHTGAWDHAAYFFPESGAWLSQHLWDHYQYNLDEEFLRDVAYPIMKETSQFWVENLRVDPRDGTLVAVPSRSPEIGPSTAGTSMSQQLLWHLFTDTAQAAALVGDAEFAREATAVLEDLDPGLRVGSWGQLQEWKDDIDSPDETHRHVSHMFAVHPGRQISPHTTPELADAAKVSLNARTDAGTGWSKAWKINFWARLLDGDRSHKLLVDQLRESTLPNLWDTHPPFQIDGNFGGTSGITEMLLQSHLGTVDLLPALPAVWPDGSVDGLRARGALTVGMSWQSGNLTEARLTSDKGGEVTLRSDTFHGPVRVYQADGRPVDHTVDGDLLTLPTKAGHTYRIVAQVAVGFDVPGESVRPGDSVPVSVALTAADHRNLPRVQASVEVPDGWNVRPGSAALGPVRPGSSASAEFVVDVPAGTADGSYPLTAVVASDEWAVRAPARLELFRPNIAPGQTDACCSARLRNYYVFVSETPFDHDSVAATLAQPGVEVFADVSP
jgi:alpha-L-fucosidase 2